jgi:hypothetical protein
MQRGRNTLRCMSLSNSVSDGIHVAQMMLFRGAKPVQLFAQGEQDEVSSDEKVTEDLIVEGEVQKIDIDDDDENPF